MSRSAREPVEGSTDTLLAAVVEACPLPTLVTCAPHAPGLGPVRASRSLLELLDVEAAQLEVGLGPFTTDRDGPARLVEAADRALDTDSTVVVRGVRLRRRSDVFVADVHLRAFPLGDRHGVVTTVVDRSLDREIISTLENRASFDPLTGLLRREAMLDRIDRANDARPPADGLHLTAVIFCDVNSLKAVNDRLGHHAGDALIGAMAGRLERSIRPGDLASRWGGDEFVVWARDLPDYDAAVTLAERIRDHTRGTAVVGGQAVAASMAIGLAVTADDEVDPLMLVDVADAAMYRSKQDPDHEVAVTMVPKGRRSGSALG